MLRFELRTCTGYRILAEGIDYTIDREKSEITLVTLHYEDVIVICKGTNLSYFEAVDDPQLIRYSSRPGNMHTAMHDRKF